MTEDATIVVHSHGRGWTAYCPAADCMETRSNMFRAHARSLVAEHVVAAHCELVEADEPEFSPEALRKQAEYDRLKAEGKPIPTELFLGIYEPATQPTERDRCRHCGADARSSTMFGGDGEFCWLCLSRGRDEDYRDMSSSPGHGQPGGDPA